MIHCNFIKQLPFRLLRRLSIILIFTFYGSLSAQYYDWGQNPASVKWKQMQGDNGKIVFPSYYEAQANKLLHYMDSVRSKVGYGFKYGPMKIPLVTHTQNFSPNGLVVLAPKRMEFIVTPPTSTYATPWLKQLTVHEYRHSVQYSNMNRGFIKGMSYVLGEQGSLFGVTFFPVWMMEGDAVLTETQFTTCGRGLQPSFTIEYRAMALEGDKKYAADKYFSGSFKDYMPDHYQLGYQIMSYAYTKYGENIWDKVAWYGSRNPYFLLSPKFALKKFYDTSVTKLFDETKEDLAAYWRSLPVEENSSEIINTPTTSYTTYLSPLSAGGDAVYALKTDLDRTTRIVEVELTSGKEKILHKTGVVNTGLALSGGKLWWTEMRQSTLWEQRVNSVLCWYDLESGKSEKVPSKRHSLFPSASYDNNVAYVEYDHKGVYSFNHGEWRMELPDTISVHGFSYDDLTGQYYFIGLSDSGMWIGTANESNSDVSIVKEPSYSSLANLKASGGKLYYNSIATGKDEAHVFDIANKNEYKATTSKYGSFDPSPITLSGDSSGIVLTTYTKDGYMLAVNGHLDKGADPLIQTNLPVNKLNPERTKWDVMNIDTLVVPPSDTTSRTSKKYRKGLNLFRFHSWAPIDLEPDKILDESEFNVHLGLTLMSQNLLNSTFTTLNYRYTDEGSLYRAKVNYFGWAPRFEVEAEAGSMNQLLYKPSDVEFNGKRKNHFRMESRVYLPLLFSSGYHYRRLTPQIEYEYENVKRFSPKEKDKVDFRTGMQKLKFSLYYSDNVAMSHRDFLPRWGYALRVTRTVNPFNKQFGKIWSGYGRIYAPGIGPHHSLMVRAAVQSQKLSYYNYRQKELYPRGANYRITPQRYGSFAIDYQFPVWYPDGGISSLLYFKRIRTNLTFDYARYRLVKGMWNYEGQNLKVQSGKWHNINSYGIEFTFDIAPIRLPSSTSTAFKLSIHKPSDKSGVFVSGSFVMPI